ncbi:ribonuclease P protein component [Tomitella fengzijianii]|uniref:Ribonuclease P protein component n=1 Tax=Tomitella fengzijianii TaxID=2597660 RepID=A0A516X762_9ACTN|nr:ribonuclease P protein component [Tomitella fengzijianii]QDQ98880.1 ribonuclease P protein component [Tomitella fengzijianii]
MLQDRYRLRHRGDFTAVMRGGRRCGRRDIVVHAATAYQPVFMHGPRFGLIVSTAVGNSVVRHRVSRRLRHVAAGYVDQLEPGVSVVLRALPGAAYATSAQLDRQVGGGLSKLGLLTHREASR